MRSAVHDHHLKRARKHFVTKKCSVTHRRSAIAIALSRKHDRDVTVEACWFIARKYEDVQAVCSTLESNEKKIVCIYITICIGVVPNPSLRRPNRNGTEVQKTLS